MAEQGSPTAGEDGGHPSAVARELRRPERIDAVVDPVGLAALNPPVDRLPADADAKHLPRGNGSVLQRRQPREAAFTSVIGVATAG